MAIDMLRAMTSLLSTCSRKVSRAARKLRGSPFLNARQLIALRLDRRRKLDREKYEEKYLDEEEVWRRGIIMGEKCQPLEFSGVIHYDSDGRQMAGVPRSPMRSQLPAFSVADDKAWK